MSIEVARIIDLPIISDPRGNLTFVEGQHHIPFAIQRVYYVYDVPGGQARGGHAHRRDQEFLIAVSGSFRVNVTDADTSKSFYLKRSYYGLYLPSMLWRDLDDFATGSVCLVLASNPYSESDYIRDFQVYRQAQGLAE